MKLAICIPFRDSGDGVRDKHLKEFIPYMTEFLNNRNIEHKFFIGHQADDNLFNRSLMKNVPFIVAKEQGLPLTVETCPQYLYFNAEDIGL